MTNNMTSMPISLLNRWIQENNDLVRKWKQQERGDTLIQDQDQSRLRSYSSEFHKLLRTIQGVPTAAEHAQLELTVVYNACVLSLTQMQYPEAELLFIQGLERAQGLVGSELLVLDHPLLFWRAALKSLGKSVLHSSIKQLFCLQWAIWLSTCKLEAIQDLQEELSSLSEDPVTGMENERKGVTLSESPETPLVVLEPRELRDLLQICTAIAQGAELLSEARSSEALSTLQNISSIPAPRTLLANTHLLSGLCLAHMGRLQMAVQYYRKALETDSHCVCALYQSTLIYKQLGNTKAEIQALQLLHSMLMLPRIAETAPMGSNLLHPSLLLRSQSLSRLLLVPSSLSILHSLALKSVLHGRVSEGVEHYLDLLATLQSDDQHTVHAEAPPLPRLPELYLEAGAALLLARRPADCMALCDEVINTTLELLPEKLVLEEPVGDCDADFGSADRLGSGTDQDRLGMLLWSGTALLLQAHCQAYLKDWKNAVTLYTRSINLLVKVQVKKKGFQPQIPCVDIVGRQASGLNTLQRLKGLSLAGRGISFTQRDQLREALRDLQLSLQASPECVNAGQWLGEVLWRLGRKREAVSCWEKTWGSAAESSVKSLPLYLRDLHSGPTLDPTDLRRRIEELTHTL